MVLVLHSHETGMHQNNGILLTILPFSSFQSRVTYTLIFLAILDSICNRNGNCWVSLQIVYHCMCYKAKIRFFCQVMNTQGSLCFSSSQVFFLPASLLVTLVFRWRICQPVSDTKASTPHARKKPFDTQGSFQVGEKAFSFKSNIFVAPLFDELLSDTLFMDCFLLFLSSWSFDGTAVWHTMWYVGSWCYCIYIVSFTVLSQFNFYEMHMTSSVGSVSQILYVNRSVYFSWLCVYFSYFHVKGKLCVNEDSQINIIIPPANERANERSQVKVLNWVVFVLNNSDCVVLNLFMMSVVIKPCFKGF